MRIASYRPLAMLLLVLHLSGCQSWRTTTVSPQQLIEEEQPSSIRVTLTSGEVVLLEEPRVASDSIEGVITGAFLDVDDGLVAAVASRDIAAMEVRRFSPGRTFGAVALGGAAVVGVAIAIFVSGLPRCKPRGNVGPCR